MHWDAFQEKYSSLQKYFEQHFGVKVDAAKELDGLKTLRERLIKNGMIVDTVFLMNDVLNNTKKRVLYEGANAAMLDIDFGTYPYLTSSNTWAGGIFTGLGVPANALETTIGIMKAYCTRVGEGPFPTE